MFTLGIQIFRYSDIHTYSFGKYKLIKDSYDQDFTTWEAVFGLKNRF